MRHIEIYDTTLRDGSQGEGVSFSLADKLQLTKQLDAVGVDYIEGGFPASNDKDIQYFREVAGLGLNHAKVSAFGMTRRKGGQAAEDKLLLALLDANTPVVTIVGKSSAFQVREVLLTTCEENLAMIADSVALAVSQKREVIFDAEHFFDGWKADAAYSLEALRTAVKAGATTIVLCDTNGGTMPETIAEITRAVVAALPVKIGIHCHNDCDLAVANSLAAVDAGASQVQGTINGFGERCGNADLISVVANLALKKSGYQVLDASAGLEWLTELSRFVYETANANFRSSQPFVGKSAFAHKGGMHASGVARNTAAYEHIDPAVVGNKQRILVSELSGRSNIAARTTEDNLNVDPQFEARLLAQMVALESLGYQFEAAKGSRSLLERRCQGTFRPHFEPLKYHVKVEKASNGTITTLAEVKIRVGDEVHNQRAKGAGPIDALDKALRKALSGSFSNLKLRLDDYKVRVINSQAATAARVRVEIESWDEDGVWGTVGVSENIIEASWIALVDSFEYKLSKDEARKPHTSFVRNKNHGKSFFTDIFAAAAKGTSDDVRYFVEEKVDLNKKNEYGNTPLNVAAKENSDVKVLEYLISQGADVHAKNKQGGTPLHRAAAYNFNIKVLEYLISQGADVHAKNKQGGTPLHRAAANNSNVKILEYLVSQGADLNAKNKYGWTPLHCAAAWNRNIEILKYLISQGANLNVKANFSRWRGNDTPLDIANTKEKKDILREAMQKK